MPKETVNRRVQFTKTALRDAMIELICEKPLTSITVKDVCARADINRSTFYLHYKDVDSLLVAVEDYAIEYIQSHFKGLGNAFDELVGFLTYMKNTPRLRNLFFVLAGERGDPRFTRRLHIGKKTDKLIKSITQPLEVGLDILDRVVLDRDEQRVHILVVQVECAGR